MNYWKYYLLALLVIGIDQLSKWAVHTYMLPGLPGEVALIGSWAKLHYMLNAGMAFGVELPPPYGKILLTAFRLVAVTGIGYFIYQLGQRPGRSGLYLLRGAYSGRRRR